MSKWIYRSGREVTPESIPEWAVGFIYAIYNNRDRVEGAGKYYEKHYVGKKQLTSTRTKKIGKRAQMKQATEIGDKRRVKKVEKVVKSSNWENYWSSCEELKSDVRRLGEASFTRIILEWCHSKKYMGYAEVKHQIIEEVLDTPSYNGNIAGRWYRKDMKKEQ
jgi:hypothetical protein